jgi:hypothetical protein
MLAEFFQGISKSRPEQVEGPAGKKTGILYDLILGIFPWVSWIGSGQILFSGASMT